MLSYRTLFLPYRFDDAAFMPSLVTRPSFRSIQFGQKGIPYLNTYDCQRIRYPDPKIKANDTIRLDLESNKIVDFIMFDAAKVKETKSELEHLQMKILGGGADDGLVERSDARLRNYTELL
ncbi:hypothetical protein V6N11_029677 [Hibiscus sabdariffa]|uniref:Small ribosomal subunit protein eS4 central region domain-containing protein n=2 Tax=Hibiscus sabdariffa TaxID=183260 RepID=A0ABR2P7Z6_9ROSI